jgi:hypothetical protein
MGALSYLFCLVFPPLEDVAPVIALLSFLVFGAAAAFLWQSSVAETMSPLEWSVSCGGFSVASLAVFLATSWQIGVAPSEALFSFPKHTWEEVSFAEQRLIWKGIRGSLAAALGTAFFGIGSFVRWRILAATKPPLTTRSTWTARKRAAG